MIAGIRGNKEKAYRWMKEGAVTALRKDPVIVIELVLHMTPTDLPPAYLLVTAAAGVGLSIYLQGVAASVYRQRVLDEAI